MHTLVHHFGYTVSSKSAHCHCMVEWSVL